MSAAQESVWEIDAARRAGHRRGRETCPQYLLLTAEEHLGGLRAHATSARRRCAALEDQDLLWQALADGMLHVVSTDHCPWTLTEKHRPDFTQIPGGVPSIEARLALVHHFGVNQGRCSLERWVQVCATNAARWMGLTTKGRMARRLRRRHRDL
jgi:dihydropyrimidinase